MYLQVVSYVLTGRLPQGPYVPTGRLPYGPVDRTAPSAAEGGGGGAFPWSKPDVRGGGLVACSMGALDVSS